MLSADDVFCHLRRHVPDANDLIPNSHAPAAPLSTFPLEINEADTLVSRYPHAACQYCVPLATNVASLARVNRWLLARTSCLAPTTTDDDEEFDDADRDETEDAELGEELDDDSSSSV